MDFNKAISKNCIMTRIFKTLGAGIFILVAWSFTNQVFAQAREVKGRVTSSENNQPLQGVTVTIKGTKTAVVTDADGNYKITVATTSNILTFSSVGFVAYEAGIAGKTE